MGTSLLARPGASCRGHFPALAEPPFGLRRLAPVPRPQWGWSLRGARTAADLERNQSYPVEDTHPWARLVIPSHLGDTNLAHDGHRRRQRAVRDLCRSRQWQNPPRLETVRRREASIRAQVQHLCFADTSHRGRARLHDLRFARNSLSGYQDRQGPVGAAGLRMQSLSRSRFLTDSFWGSAPDEFRRQRSPVRRRARQTDRENRVATG